MAIALKVTEMKIPAKPIQGEAIVQDIIAREAISPVKVVISPAKTAVHVGQEFPVKVTSPAKVVTNLVQGIFVKAAISPVKGINQEKAAINPVKDINQEKAGISLVKVVISLARVATSPVPVTIAKEKDTLPREVPNVVIVPVPPTIILMPSTA